MSTIGSRLCEAMTEAGMTQTRLCGVSGIPQATISRIMNDRSEAEARTIRALAKALKLNFDWLNEGIGAKYRDESQQPEPGNNKNDEPVISKTAMRVAVAFDRMRPSQKPLVLRAVGISVIGPEFDKNTVSSEEELEYAAEQQGDQDYRIQKS